MPTARKTGGHSTTPPGMASNIPITAVKTITDTTRGEVLSQSALGSLYVLANAQKCRPMESLLILCPHVSSSIGSMREAIKRIRVARVRLKGAVEQFAAWRKQALAVHAHRRLARNHLWVTP